ncbi:PP2C family protein-serine/threonine phosphatase [Cellulomonas marina]|uniref:Serine phosphatase RsbU, regulator of sigma subunit n=1 Tax=Cellulomonas marina TaxID=988821 RepID=A0A1I0VJN6_9CELL|nr:SpoIIE family protein phosphatase [Cellulomonas marina]GIG27922.1 serine/threonine phosphatase [Cellulomonas marina]SFA76604.1 Serine phosphatase RsbU, regulator of sigma subunit [Cellulomonas marina]
MSVHEPATAAGASHADTGREHEAREDVLRVLLVEDDDADALLVREHLQDAGLQVELVQARTLDEALQRLDADCVLLDLGLPDARGLPALERLLAGGAPPVVVLTGLADTRTGLAAVAAGAQDYLVKQDVEPETLGRAVRYAVQRTRWESAERELFRSGVRAQETLRLERALLPRPVVHDPRLVVEVAYRSGRDGVLGGDFYDVVERPDGTVLAVVGDVCGHGPDEAALGATLRTAWRTLVLAEHSPACILALLERVLRAERAADWVFTTAAMVVVAPDRRSAELYLAGHPAALLVGPPTAVVPPVRRGRALGLPLDGGWEPQHVPLEGDWRLLVYTDGLLEATIDDEGDRLGKERLVAVVEGVARAADARGDGSGVVEAVLDAVQALHGGPLVDDSALVLLGCVPGSAAHADAAPREPADGAPA